MVGTSGFHRARFIEEMAVQMTKKAVIGLMITEFTTVIHSDANNLASSAGHWLRQGNATAGNCIESGNCCVLICHMALPTKNR